MVEVGALDPMRAWYSAKQAKKYGSRFWKREDGTEVELVWVLTPGSGPPVNSDDWEGRGLVTYFSRDGQPRPDEGEMVW